MLHPFAGKGCGFGMDTGGDTLRPARAPRPVADRERFLTFALTAAEMLIEVSPEGRIGFAAGTFESRMGQPPQAWLGRPVREMVAPADRRDFEMSFGLLLARDRLPPTGFRLADAAATPISVAGLRLPERDSQRLCLTFAAMPQPAAAPPARGLMGPAALRETGEAGLRRAGPGGRIGLIELAGPDGPLGTEAGLLGPLIGQTLADALAADAVVGELAAGRYGVISGTSADLAAIGAQIEAVVRKAGLDAAVATSSLALDAEGLTPMQATRALRYALSTFARGGPEAMQQAGFADGLSGFVAIACSRALALRQSIAERRFGMAFQPIVSLGDGAIHHVEALLRPQPGPDGQWDRPGDFVTFAETVGLSEELDWAVLEAVCGAARRSRGIRIAANLSGLSLQSPGFRARLLELLDAEPLLASRLLIEITETAEIEDEAEAVRMVEALRRRGLPLCIDDFGAGAAAFRYLRAFRVDYVKIDGIYVRNAMRSEQDRGIVAAMVDLARNVGAQVVAEQIETAAEAAAMRDLGVGYAQGWHFGRPGPLPGG
jgi:EAL domain-containing protein (putative c-di-GMP-specific phosphodiesterase class I)